MFQFTTSSALLILLGFYGATFLLTLRIGKKQENADGYMTASGSVGYGMSAASMTATWIWAAAF